MNLRIAKATKADLASLNRLVNSAYRGDEARKGWTHEADLIAGTQRTDETSLQQLITTEGSVLLVCFVDEAIAGCVNLQAKRDHLYLGMLSVDPDRQRAGIGKKLLFAAEEHARALGLPAIEMTVISVRTELIDWYQRHGYTDTGHREPFPDDPRFGIPREPLQFVVLRKALS